MVVRHFPRHTPTPPTRDLLVAWKEGHLLGATTNKTAALAEADARGCPEEQDGQVACHRPKFTRPGKAEVLEFPAVLFPCPVPTWRLARLGPASTRKARAPRP